MHVSPATPRVFQVLPSSASLARAVPRGGSHSYIYKQPQIISLQLNTNSKHRPLAQATAIRACEAWRKSASNIAATPAPSLADVSK